MANPPNEDHKVFEEAKKYFRNVSKRVMYVVEPRLYGKGLVDPGELCQFIAEKKLNVVVKWLYAQPGIRIVSTSRTTNSVYFTTGGESCRLSDHRSGGFMGRQFIVYYKTDPIEIIQQIIHLSWTL